MREPPDFFHIGYRCGNLAELVQSWFFSLRPKSTAQEMKLFAPAWISVFLFFLCICISMIYNICDIIHFRALLEMLSRFFSFFVLIQTFMHSFVPARLLFSKKKKKKKKNRREKNMKIARHPFKNLRGYSFNYLFAFIFILYCNEEKCSIHGGVRARGRGCARR